MGASILVIDDSDLAREKIVDVLEKSKLCSDIYQARDGQEGLAVLRDVTVDLVLCDLTMPQMDGVAFLKAVKGHDVHSDLPVILLTVNDTLDIKVNSLNLGASDFITKPFVESELLARIGVQLKLKRQQDELKRTNRLLRDLSVTDPLTGLSNRRCLSETLQREIKRSRYTGAPLSLLMADIDHFKRVNDGYGHQGGDSVLVAVARMLSQGLREYDLAARYGGEEFAIVLPETKLESAVQIADRVRLQIAGLRFPEVGKTLRVTLSVGVSSYSPEVCPTVEALISAADRALYRAKAAGRNRVGGVDGIQSELFGDALATSVPPKL